MAALARRPSAAGKGDEQAPPHSTVEFVESELDHDHDRCASPLVAVDRFDQQVILAPVRLAVTVVFAGEAARG